MPRDIACGFARAVGREWRAGARIARGAHRSGRGGRARRVRLLRPPPQYVANMAGRTGPLLQGGHSECPRARALEPAVPLRGGNVLLVSDRRMVRDIAEDCPNFAAAVRSIRVGSSLDIVGAQIFAQFDPSRPMSTNTAPTSNPGRTVGDRICTWFEQIGVGTDLGRGRRIGPEGSVDSTACLSRSGAAWSTSG